MRKHGGTPSRRDKHVTPAAISPPGDARGRFVGGHQSGLAGCKPPPLFKRGASSRLSQRQRQREPRGASPRPSAPTYLPSSIFPADRSFIVSCRSRSSPVLRNWRLFCRPIEAKPGASSSWCWGVHGKHKILYKLKNSSLK